MLCSPNFCGVCVNIEIQFAYRTFKWNSESSNTANVHCVIIGFSCSKIFSKKLLIDGDIKKEVNHINEYLVDADDIFIERRSSSLLYCEEMLTGSEPRDGGFLLVNIDERKDILNKHPDLENYIPRYITGDDYINNKYRYCLWLKNINLSEIRKYPFIIERLKGCAEFRKNSKQQQAYKMSELPYLFVSERQPQSDYLLIPQASSENRRYIPIGYMSKDVIVSNTCFTISHATKYSFGILISNVHMAWVRAVCGRLEMRYRYSNTIVYNNFPWPSPTDDQKSKIEKTAQGILDARALYPDSSLADLYDPLTMPPELQKAHTANDRAVMQAYGFSIKDMSEADCVAELMRMYQELTKRDGE